MQRFSKLLRVPLFALGLGLTLGPACTQKEADAPKSDAPAGAEQAASEPKAPPVEQLPSGAELLTAHVEASGGAEQIAKFETIHATGVVEVPDHKLKGTMELWWQKDGKVYLEQEVEGVGKSRFGYDGETVWLEDPITGLRELDGEEAASYLQSSLMFLGHDWKQHFAEAKTLGKQPLEGGGEAWEIELVSKQGPNVTIGLDTKTKLIRYMKSTQTTLMGDMPIEVHSDRYEEVEGYKFSMHKVNAISGLLELDETITKFEVNVPVDPTMFAFPSKRELVPADPGAQPPVEAPKPAAPEAPAKDEQG